MPAECRSSRTLHRVGGCAHSVRLPLTNIRKTFLAILELLAGRSMGSRRRALVAGNPDLRLWARIPAVVRARPGPILWVQSVWIRRQNPGVEDVSGPRGSPDPDGIGAVVAHGQILGWTCKVPAQSGIDGQTRS